MTKQNISTLTQFLQFKDSKNWVKSYLSENNLNESDLDKSEFKLIDFNGLKFHLFNQTIDVIGN